MRILTWAEKLGRPECPYLQRWALNLGFCSIRLHRWFTSDDERAKHDHPWWFITCILWGSYTDISSQDSEEMTPGKIKFRSALHRHTVRVHPKGCLTLMITGPQIRKWGFWIKGDKKFMKSNKYFLTYGHHPCNQEILNDNDSRKRL